MLQTVKKVVAIIDDTVYFEDEFSLSQMTLYLDLAKAILKEGRNPKELKWHFKDVEFADLESLVARGLSENDRIINKVKEENKQISYIKDIDFKEKIIVINPKVSDTLLMKILRKSPTFWALKIKRGKDTFKNASEFAKQFFITRTEKEMKDLTSDYFDGDEE